MNKESSNFYKLLAIRQLGLLCVYTRCPARRRRDLLSHHWWETSLAVHHRVFNARFCVSLFESVLLRGECWPILSVREPAHWRFSLKWCHVAVSEWQWRYEIQGNRKKCVRHSSETVAGSVVAPRSKVRTHASLQERPGHGKWFFAQCLDFGGRAHDKQDEQINPEPRKRKGWRRKES